MSILQEKIPEIRENRRILQNAPDPTYRRVKADRRGHLTRTQKNQSNTKGSVADRYEINSTVNIIINTKTKINGRIENISKSGIKIHFSEKYKSLFPIGKEVKLIFEIPEGSMVENYEYKIKIRAFVIRYQESENNQVRFCVAFKFKHSLEEHLQKRKWSSQLALASSSMFFITLLITLLRFESIIYFRYRPFLYGYSLLTAAYLLSRYLFSIFYQSVPVQHSFQPGVSIIIPCFNEEKWISKTIISCLDQNYPLDKLQVIVVDDCSTDNSPQVIKDTIEMIKRECSQYKVEERLSCVLLNDNVGKREALIEGVKHSKHELISFVDSDSFLEPVAIRHLVQPFIDKKVGGVTGRTDVANASTNYITKMQSVRYYVAFRVLKAAESVFDAVTCLSGPISCYRASLIYKYKKDWTNQKFLGVKATFGDDRSMTNYILNRHRTVYQDSAVCKTIVPSSLKVFYKQQMRWKRSWLRESIRAGKFMWRKEPFQAISFYAGFIIPILAPAVVIYNLLYIPITRQLWPVIFLGGMLLMSLMMSFVYLMLRKSKMWIYGLWFCLFYECVLLWQMPIACLTFWKSQWGTRKTKHDVAAEKKKEERKKRKKVKQ